MESTLTISQSQCRAIRRDKAVLPIAVGPTITKSGLSKMLSTVTVLHLTEEMGPGKLPVLFPRLEFSLNLLYCGADHGSGESGESIRPGWVRCLLPSSAFLYRQCLWEWLGRKTVHGLPEVHARLPGHHPPSPLRQPADPAQSTGNMRCLQEIRGLEKSNCSKFPEQNTPEQLPKEVVFAHHP